jgi:hypothetical protein
MVHQDQHQEDILQVVAEDPQTLVFQEPLEERVEVEQGV